MQAYDLVDTLVHINYKAVFGRTSLLKQIQNATIIYKPQGNFIIITAQQDSADVHSAISEMVSKNFPNCEHVHFVSGSETEIADSKARIIEQKNITDFTDNNVGILAKIKAKGLNVKLWRMTQDGRKAY